MNMLDQYVPSDDSDFEPTLPPGEAMDEFDAQTSAPDDDLDGDPFVDAGVDDQPLPSEQRDWEAEAKSMGWKDPKVTGKGADAKSFVLGSRKEGERLLTQVDDMTRAMRQMQAEQRRAQIEARADGYRRALSAIKAEQQRARTEYDLDGHERALRQEAELMYRARQEAAQIEMEQRQHQQQQTAAPDPVWDGWVAENQWYEKDQELQALADSVGAVFAQQGLTGRPLMDRVTQALRASHPHKFTNPRRKNAPVSDANTARGGEATSLNTMPNEIRAAFTDFYDEHKAEFKTKEAARKYFMNLMKG